MIRIIFFIAKNTFKETIRNKILYNILLVAGVALLLSMSFGDLSVFARGQVMADFGLATMSMTGLLLAVFIGVGMLGTEITTKTVYGILTKPIHREAFIFGKFSGLIATLFLNFLLIAVLFFISIKFMGASESLSIVYAMLLLLIEMTVIVAASMFFSSLTTPTLAAVFTLGFYIVGHLNDLVNVSLVEHANGAWYAVLKVFYYLLPNLEHFNIRTQIIYNLPVPSGYIPLAVLYGLLYASLFLTLAAYLFSRKDV
jgi:ABC-type transport system involved in multi-copper enzyme maturation permease subunit